MRSDAPYVGFVTKAGIKPLAQTLYGTVHNGWYVFALDLEVEHFTPKYVLQSGLNISESVILTNSNNDTDLVGTIFSALY